MTAETARAIVGHGGVRPLIEICQIGDSVSQAAVACTLKNISAVAESACNDNLRRFVISEGGIRSLLVYLDGPLPQESPVAALRNLIGSVSSEVLMSLNFMPIIRLIEHEMQKAHDIIWSNWVSQEAFRDGNPRCQEATREVRKRKASKFVHPKIG
ncbi:hypothetical protein V6N11_034659 [Hibiscus sabdariffa]|uniref:Uncharacterized protein n=1 Tax=Hibiscus sabdariffa TaxID=183260 RepID=A0ABR2NDP7_9ROSI